MLKKLTMIFAVLALVLGFNMTGIFSSASAATEATSGDLIRGSLPAVYYLGIDGRRYVFPNEKTYDTWYQNFDTVKFISDADLGKIQIGGNVTYRPGVKMLKINTDAKTYAVGRGGELRHVTSEAVATGLYGSSWNTMIDDIADSFFTNYFVGDPINTTADFDPATETANSTDINSDKEMLTPKEVSIISSGFSPTSITTTVGRAGRFTNNDSTTHAVTGDNLTWGSGSIQPGENYIFVFDNAGTYSYFDSLNASNTGAITVIN